MHDAFFIWIHIDYANGCTFAAAKNMLPNVLSLQSTTIELTHKHFTVELEKVEIQLSVC